MRHRAIKDLSQLTRDDFIQQVSAGLLLIYKSAKSLSHSAIACGERGEGQAANILHSIANEEAAKFLILIDAVRCPKTEKAMLARQLEKYNEHLAKGIYAEMCMWKPDKYSALKSYIEDELSEHYLDGPEGVEWIFRNRIISKREESLYVDYVQYDEDSHEWCSPHEECHLGVLTQGRGQPVAMIEALFLCGISSPACLNVFSEFWQNIVISDDTHYQELRRANHESVEMLDNKGLLLETSDDNYSLIVDDLQFPAYKEPMKMNRVPIKDLVEIQENWSPYW